MNFPISIVYEIFKYLPYFEWYENNTLPQIFNITIDEFEHIRHKIYLSKMVRGRVYKLEDVIHRDEIDGPAIQYGKSYLYCKNGKPHRINGPAYYICHTDALKYFNKLMNVTRGNILNEIEYDIQYCEVDEDAEFLAIWMRNGIMYQGTNMRSYSCSKMYQKIIDNLP
jgi:hypothetical protein